MDEDRYHEEDSCSTDHTKRSDFSIHSGHDYSETSFGHNSQRSNISSHTSHSETSSQIVGQDDFAVADISSYSTSLVYLTPEGKIIKGENGHHLDISSNIRPSKIEKYAGYLYAISDGMLYMLENESFSRQNWIWSQCEWVDCNDIIHISATLDNSCIWIQSYERGFLYNKTHKMIDNFTVNGFKRRYGYDKSSYIDYYEQDRKSYVFRSGKSEVIENVYAAAMTKDGHVVHISKSERHMYRDVKIVNWAPCYIYRK